MSEVIPEGWSIESLGSLAGKITSGATPKVDNPRYYGGTVPFLKIDDITSLRGRYVHTAKQFITDQALNETSAKLFPPGTVLTTMYGTIGSTAILSKAMATNQAIAAFIDLQNTTSEYLYQLLTFEAPRLASSASQTTQANISGAVLKEYCVPVPPLPEQQKIATILSSVDDVIEKTRTQIDKLKDLKTGMMQELLTKGMGHAEFKDSPVGRVPRQWQIRKIDEVVSKVGSGITPKGGSATYAESGIPLIRSQNVHSDGLRLEDVSFISGKQHQKMLNSQLKPNDVLLNITGASIGRCYYLPEYFGEANVNQHVCIIRPIPTSIHHVYLTLFLNSQFGQRQIMSLQAGGNREGLNFKQVRSITLPVPPLSEQRLISVAVSTIDTEIGCMSKKLVNVRSLKKALMQDLLTGKVRVKLDSPQIAAA